MNSFLCEYILKRHLFLWSKLYFEHHLVFSVTWSSEISLICWFAAQETFLIIINVDNSCAASFFMETDIYILGFFDAHKFKNSIFCKKLYFAKQKFYCHFLAI